MATRLTGIGLFPILFYTPCKKVYHTWSIRRFGSGVMTVRAEKSTRLPIKFPRIRPSLLYTKTSVY